MNNLNSKMSLFVKILALCEYYFTNIFFLMNIIFGLYYTTQQKTQNDILMSLTIITILCFNYLICNINYKYEYTEFIIGFMVSFIIFFATNGLIISGGVIIIIYENVFYEYGYLLIITSSINIVYIIFVITVFQMENGDEVANRKIHRYFMKKLYNINPSTKFNDLDLDYKNINTYNGF